MTKKPINRSLERMREHQEEQRAIKKFNNSEEGKALHKKIRDMHRKDNTNMDEIPF